MVSVIIPTFNRLDALLRLLEDLSRQEGVAAELIVVDDHSSDGTGDVVRSRFPTVVYLRNDTNLGPTISRNRGIRQAQGDIVVGFDSDVTVPDAGLLARIETAFAGLPPLRAFAFRVVESDGRTDDAPRWWHPVPLAHYADRRFESHYFSGTAYAFRKHELLQVGGFPECIFQYFEEVEVAFRFLDAGGVILYMPELAVLHHPGSRSSAWTDYRLFYHSRNLVLLTLACYPPIRGAGFLLPRLANAFLRAVTSNRLPVFFRAIRSSAQAAPGRLRERQPLQASTWRRIQALRHAHSPAPFTRQPGASPTSVAPSGACAVPPRA